MKKLGMIPSLEQNSFWFSFIRMEEIFSTPRNKDRLKEFSLSQILLQICSKYYLCITKSVPTLSLKMAVFSYPNGPEPQNCSGHLVPREDTEETSTIYTTKAGCPFQRSNSLLLFSEQKMQTSSRIQSRLS